ncbi:OmpH family outer membrane protein [uncultured Cytophaga sp.]|uniref:OmpH family outer membrane protein n=1 Tax=uncultured Cytophaga sp. TaxID=160238 RepID=UPI0026269AA5|nr:OmpH family outer membrane protein [uncultured Cytophaga sp.]
MKRILSTLLVALFSVIIIQAQAQTEPLKIGTANVEFILSNLPETKKVEADLQTYEKQLRTQLENKGTEYQRKLDEYQRGVQSGMMPAAVIADKEKELMTMQQSIQEFEKTAQEDLQSKSMAMLDPILDKVQVSIDKVAAANNYTYIISTHVDYGGSAIILYSKNKDANDISALVLKDMGIVISQTGSTTTPAAPAPANPTTPATPAKTVPAKK